jgi:hypothetical protein
MRLQNAVFANPPTKGGELFLLVNLARYAADDGSRVYPSVSRLMKETAQCRRAIETQLASLVAKGIIEIVRRQTAKPTEYRICAENIYTDPACGAGSKKQTPHLVPKDPAPSAKTPALNADDSLIDSLYIHQNRVEKNKTVKTAAGDAALRSMKELLGKSDG